MSAECDNCGEHILDCKCPQQIRVWAQMFFKDGSVTQGKRFPAHIMENVYGEFRTIALHLLESVGRSEGLLLVWGAGEIHQRYYVFEEKFTSSSSSSEPWESDSSA